jgi:hypothetical protein
VKSIVGMHIEGSFFYDCTFFNTANREEKKRKNTVVRNEKKKETMMMMTDCFPL